jgi:hypothetical protein
VAKKIRVYQNETDINDPEYVDGYTNIVEEHYSAFQAQSKVANEFLRRQEMAVKDSYQTAGVNYQIKGLIFLVPVNQFQP